MFKTWYYSLVVRYKSMYLHLRIIYNAWELIENFKVNSRVVVAICYNLNSLLIKTSHRVGITQEL